MRGDRGASTWRRSRATTPSCGASGARLGSRPRSYPIPGGSGAVMRELALVMQVRADCPWACVRFFSTVLPATAGTPRER